MSSSIPAVSASNAAAPAMTWAQRLKGKKSDASATSTGSTSYTSPTANSSSRSPAKSASSSREDAHGASTNGSSALLSEARATSSKEQAVTGSHTDSIDGTESSAASTSVADSTPAKASTDSGWAEAATSTSATGTSSIEVSEGDKSAAAVADSPKAKGPPAVNIWQVRKEEAAKKAAEKQREQEEYRRNHPEAAVPEQELSSTSPQSSKKKKGKGKATETAKQQQGQTSSQNRRKQQDALPSSSPTTSPSSARNHSRMSTTTSSVDMPSSSATPLNLSKDDRIPSPAASVAASSVVSGTSASKMTGRLSVSPVVATVTSSVPGSAASTSRPVPSTQSFTSSKSKSPSIAQASPTPTQASPWPRSSADSANRARGGSVNSEEQSVTTGPQENGAARKGWAPISAKQDSSTSAASAAGSSTQAFKTAPSIRSDEQDRDSSLVSHSAAEPDVQSDIRALPALTSQPGTVQEVGKPINGDGLALAVESIKLEGQEGRSANEKDETVRINGKTADQSGKTRESVPSTLEGGARQPRAGASPAVSPRPAVGSLPTLAAPAPRPSQTERRSSSSLHASLPAKPIGAPNTPHVSPRPRARMTPQPHIPRSPSSTSATLGDVSTSVSGQPASSGTPTATGSETSTTQRDSETEGRTETGSSATSVNSLTAPTPYYQQQQPMYAGGQINGERIGRGGRRGGFNGSRGAPRGGNFAREGMNGRRAGDRTQSNTQQPQAFPYQYQQGQFAGQPPYNYNYPQQPYPYDYSGNGYFAGNFYPPPMSQFGPTGGPQPMYGQMPGPPYMGPGPSSSISGSQAGSPQMGNQNLPPNYPPFDPYTLGGGHPSPPFVPYMAPPPSDVNGSTPLSNPSQVPTSVPQQQQQPAFFPPPHRPTPIGDYSFYVFPPDGTAYWVLGQIEFYLSPDNLAKDVFLRQNMDTQGYIDIKTIALFNRLRQLTQDLGLITSMMELSHFLEVREDKVRRKEDWKLWVMPSAKESRFAANRVTEVVAAKE